MQQNRPRLQIIRGLPGSGKTTLALKRYPHLMRLETDMFFNRQGAYRFTLLNNALAVEWFFKEIRLLCDSRLDFVTTGVFAAHTERLEKTISIAWTKGYDIYIKTLTSQYKGIHGVPKEHLDAMKESFLPERELKRMYKGDPMVHFGLMPSRYPLAHLAKIAHLTKNKKRNKASR